MALCVLSISVVSHAEQTLIQLHGGCNTVEKSRNPDCVAAMHRYCSNSGRGGGGVSQEVGRGVFGVACFNPTWYGDVPLNDLTNLHGDCNNLGQSQSGACVAAVHRWCSQTGKGEGGIVQEVGNGVFGVACFAPQSYQDVALTTLQSEHGECNSLDRSQSGACVAAMHRWCEKSGQGTAGFSQEVGQGVFGVACFNSTWYGDVRVIPIPVVTQPGGNGGGGNPPPKTGALSISLGFGAVTSPGYSCTGSATVTISSGTVGNHSQTYAFSGISSITTPPACTTAVIFTNLEPGLWHITDLFSGANCYKQIAAGQITSATIRIDGRICQ